MPKMTTKRTTKGTQKKRAGDLIDGPSWRDGYRRGAASAADIADGYNASTTHAHRLGDAILAKLNLRPGAPRPNASKIEDPKITWIRGFATGLVEMQSRLLQGADSEGVRAAARSAGVSLEDFTRAGVPPLELRVLRGALASRGRSR